MINVLIVDDHEIARFGLKQLLEDSRDIKVVGEAANGEEAVRLSKELNPHVILMDLNMPRMGGLEAMQKINASQPSVKFIVVTACETFSFPKQLASIGVLGYITKKSGMDELAAAIRKVNAGGQYLSSEAVNQMISEAVPSFVLQTPFSSLSERELQVMWMLGSGYDITEIANKLNLNHKTITTYRSRLFEKLGVKNDVELTHLGLLHGMFNKANYH